MISTRRSRLSIVRIDLDYLACVCRDLRNNWWETGEGDRVAFYRGHPHIQRAFWLSKALRKASKKALHNKGKDGKGEDSKPSWLSLSSFPPRATPL